MCTPLERVLAKLLDAKRSGKGYKACCPAHDDRNPSLSIREGEDGCVLLHCHAGCETESIVQELGLKMSDLFPPDNNGLAKPKPRIVKSYQYTDEHDKLLFEVVRLDPKGFRQRRPDGKGSFIWNMNGVCRVLYRLPNIIEAGLDSFIFFCEGEKDADRLAADGLVSTTTSGGAEKSHLTDLAPLHNRHVVILPDSDKPGQQHGQEVAAALQGKAASVRVMELHNA